MIAHETTKTSTQLVEFFAFSAKRVAFGYDDVDGPKRFHAQKTTTTPPMIVRTGTTSLPSERIKSGVPSEDLRGRPMGAAR